MSVQAFGLVFFALLGIGMVAVCGAMGAWLTVLGRRIPVQPPES